MIRALGAAGLYDDALREVQYAQRVWGDTPVLQATSAWIRHQQGLQLKATDRFTALRGAITTMRRAYPQFMAAGGETLPPEVLRIIFPLDYWPLIKKYSDLHKLDPYLIAALMAQESTFTAEIRSHANAYGLMQVIPSTGRRYARKLGIRFSTASLTNAETNVRIGTLYFKELMGRFGSSPPGAGRLQRRRGSRGDVAEGIAGAVAGRIHRQHPVRGDAGLREAHSRDGGGLSPALWWRHPDAREHAAGDAPAHRLNAIFSRHTSNLQSSHSRSVRRFTVKIADCRWTCWS